jgi:hypothetical protein
LHPHGSFPAGPGGAQPAKAERASSGGTFVAGFDLKYVDERGWFRGAPAGAKRS